MTTVESRTVLKKRYEWIVPADYDGAPYVEVQLAIKWARDKAESLGVALNDGVPWIQAGDDEILVYFEVEVKE